MDKEKSALGLPEGSIRAILAITVIGGTTLMVAILVIICAWNQNLEFFKSVMTGLVVWFSIVTMIGTFYFSSGQNTDSLKGTEKLLNGNTKSKK